MIHILYTNLMNIYTPCITMCTVFIPILTCTVHISVVPQCDNASETDCALKGRSLCLFIALYRFSFVWHTEKVVALRLSTKEKNFNTLTTPNIQSTRTDTINHNHSHNNRPILNSEQSNMPQCPMSHRNVSGDAPSAWLGARSFSRRSGT